MDEADIKAAIERAKMTDEERMSDSQATYLKAAEATKEAAYQASGEAAKIAREASQKERRLKKPLPKLEQPVVALMHELREPAALYCREFDTTFGYITNQLWHEFLKSKGRIPADKPFLFATRRTQEFKSTIAEREHTIEELQQQLKDAQVHTEDLDNDIKKVPG